MDTTDTTPPTRANRVPVTTLVRPDTLAWVNETAHEHYLSRSEVIRICLGLAKTHPKLVETLEAARQAV